MIIHSFKYFSMIIACAACSSRMIQNITLTIMLDELLVVLPSDGFGF